MRLIDADKCLDALDKIEQDYENACIMPNWYTAIGEIKQQPTAYDVNKVVEELEEIICPKRLYFCRVSKGGCNKSDDVGCIDCAIQKAIEIVKRGGKNE